MRPVGNSRRAGRFFYRPEYNEARCLASFTGSWGGAIIPGRYLAPTTDGAERAVRDLRHELRASGRTLLVDPDTAVLCETTDPPGRSGEMPHAQTIDLPLGPLKMGSPE